MLRRRWMERGSMLGLLSDGICSVRVALLLASPLSCWHCFILTFFVLSPLAFWKISLINRTLYLIGFILSPYKQNQRTKGFDSWLMYKGAMGRIDGGRGVFCFFSLFYNMKLLTYLYWLLCTPMESELPFAWIHKIIMDSIRLWIVGRNITEIFMR